MAKLTDATVKKENHCLFNKLYYINWIAIWKKYIDFKSYFILYAKINSKYNVNVNREKEKNKLLEDIIEDYLNDLRGKDGFLTQDFFRFRNFFHQKTKQNKTQ